MPSSLSISYQFSNPNSMQINQSFRVNINPCSRKRPHVVRCCSKQLKASENYYELLGVSVDSSAQEIKSAYRQLQKKYHPDIAGEQGHESTLLLNKAYHVLIEDDLRKDYDATIGRTRVKVGIGRDVVGVGSTWKGALRPQALFVDENACIGCRECVHHACNTFMMDEVHGTARVKVQYGDEDDRIKTSVDSCPVNCIHYVETEDLTVLEYLIQPQPKSGYGIYGQGWERPANVFMAAKSFHKQAENQEGQKHEYEPTKEEETPAQAQARESAYRELNIGTFSRMWSWLKENTGL